MIKTGLRLGVLLLILVPWQMISQQAGGLGMPSPLQTLAAVWVMLSEGALIEALAVSNLAMVAGYVFAFAVALPVGVLMGIRIGARRVLDPYITILIALPMISILPIVQAVFGLSLSARVFVVFLFALPYMAVNTTAGVQSVDKRLQEMAASFCSSRWQTLFRVTLRAALPGIVSGARLGLGRAVLGMVVAELLLVSSGVGNLLLENQDAFRQDFVVGIAVVLVLEGVVLMKLAEIVENKLFRWRT